MIVTDIREVSRSKVKIEIDSEFAFVLYKGELRMYGIRQGEELSETGYHELTEQVLPKRAKMRAMNLLKSRSYTSCQLKNKLIMGGYSEQIAQEAIDYVASFGYIDDEQYARDFIAYNMEQKSRQRIMTDLMKKGISKEIFQRAWEEIVGEDSGELEREQIRSLIAKKNFSVQDASSADIQRMMGFLFRRGFSIDAIRNVLLLDITSI
ncbi:MAG: regulatory protein RecX [Bacillota bacterium]|nr:regulatory protein RecX [Bacillota bacterium]